MLPLPQMNKLQRYEDSYQGRALAKVGEILRPESIVEAAEEADDLIYQARSLASMEYQKARPWEKTVMGSIDKLSMAMIPISAVGLAWQAMTGGDFAMYCGTALATTVTARQAAHYMINKVGKYAGKVAEVREKGLPEPGSLECACSDEGHVSIADEQGLGRVVDE